MRSSFAKCVKTHSKNKLVRNTNAKFDYYVLEKRFSHTNNCVYIYAYIYAYIYIYIYICIHTYIFMNRSFPKHHLRTWHCHCNVDFWISVYVFCKRALSIYAYIYVITNIKYIYTYIINIHLSYIYEYTFI